MKPKKESYAYTVLMNTTVDELNAYYLRPTIVTLSNTNSIQAVWNKESNVIMAVFWKKGSLILPNGKDISVSINDSEKRIAFEKGMYAGITKKTTINRQG